MIKKEHKELLINELLKHVQINEENFIKAIATDEQDQMDLTLIAIALNIEKKIKKVVYEVRIKETKDVEFNSRTN